MGTRMRVTLVVQVEGEPKRWGQVDIVCSQETLNLEKVQRFLDACNRLAVAVSERGCQAIMTVTFRPLAADE